MEVDVTGMASNWRVRFLWCGRGEAREDSCVDRGGLSTGRAVSGPRAGGWWDYIVRWPTVSTRLASVAQLLFLVEAVGH